MGEFFQGWRRISRHESYEISIPPFAIAILLALVGRNDRISSEYRLLDQGAVKNVSSPMTGDTKANNDLKLSTQEGVSATIPDRPASSISGEERGINPNIVRYEESGFQSKPFEHKYADSTPSSRKNGAYPLIPFSSPESLAIVSPRRAGAKQRT